MYARLTKLITTADNRSVMDKMSDKMNDFVQPLSGFVSIMFMVSEDETEYSSLVVWSSKEDAIAGGGLLREMTMPRLQGVITGPAQVSLMEVYEPIQKPKLKK